MTILDPKWKYTNADDSLKPNYLRNRFAAIRRAQKEADDAQKKADEEAARIVTTIAKRATR